jgi:hypothetical protein
MDCALRSWRNKHIKIGIEKRVTRAASIQIFCQEKYIKADTRNRGIRASPNENPRFEIDNAFPRLLTNQRDIATAAM